eukprot:TRINITY_DN42906_c0_g1_i1.p2 TRINITY_DN42906_c0_g1~~TRINITY_DN42906_c0_g1_i1.p2  ORF type:complete len:122 (+),score=10.42 TRINITY_DN42906_c0_g1_i1:30-395(+)
MCMHWKQQYRDDACKFIQIVQKMHSLTEDDITKMLKIIKEYPKQEIRINEVEQYAKGLEKSVNDLKDENTDLKKEVADLKKEVSKLQDLLISLNKQLDSNSLYSLTILHRCHQAERIQLEG